MKNPIRLADPRNIHLDGNDVLIPVAGGGLWHLHVPPGFPGEPAVWTEVPLPEKPPTADVPQGPGAVRWSDR